MITINGKTYNGSSVVMTGNRIIIDGKEVGDGKESEQKILRLEISGATPINVRSDRNIEIAGNVHGSVHADGSIQCNDVKGNCTSGGSINCDNIGGSVNAGGSVRCGDIEGNVSAGGSIQGKNFKTRLSGVSIVQTF